VSETRSTSTGTRLIRNAGARPSVWTPRRALPWTVAFEGNGGGSTCGGKVRVV
jgi:hypothetical protein